MVHYSNGVRLSWKIASMEAANKKSQCIEVDHIMLGILSLDKLNYYEAEQIDPDIQRVLSEKEKLYRILDTNNIDISQFRRELRNLLPEDNNPPVNNSYHRSSECKKAFTEAESLANNFLTINQLFVTILNSQSSEAKKLLNKKGIDTDKLKTDVLFSFYRNN